MEFNYTTLEKDMTRLSREVAEHKARPENKETSEREIVKQVIRPVIEKHIPQITETPNKETSEESTILPSYTQHASAEAKLAVEELINETFNEGLEKTIKKAAKAGPFVVDAYHDALTDKLHEELKRRKLI